MSAATDGDTSALRPAPVAASHAVDVVVDGTKRLGTLSYLVPDGMAVTPGDAVEVPYGPRRRFGMVVGPSRNATRATREICSVFGPRAHPIEIEVARHLATNYLADELALMARLAPTAAKGAVPLDAPELEVAAGPDIDLSAVAACDRPVVFAQRGPSVDPARLAALCARQLAGRVHDGQVLVLCPTVDMVERVLAEVPSGALRLDSRAERGAWRGFLQGTVRVGVGTRAAMLYGAANLAGIVVVEADHVAHRTQRQPFLHAGQAAIARGAAHQVPVVMTGLLPLPELLATARVVPVGDPDGLRCRVFSRHGAEQRRAFPAPLRAAIHQAVRRNRRVVVLCEPTVRDICSSCQRPVVDDVCVRCPTAQVVTVGWDRRRVEAVFDNRVRGVDLAGAAAVRDADVVVVFNADAPEHFPTLSPARDVAEYVMTAARMLSRTGELLVVTDHPLDHPLFAAFADGDLRSVARSVWDEARELGMAPFREVIEVSIAGRKTMPDVSMFPGEVFGPRRDGPDSWSWLVRCSRDDLHAAASALAAWRAKVRVSATRQ